MNPGLFRIGALTLGVAVLSSPAFAADDDACTLLTPAEVGVALGAAVGAGTPITPTDHKVCTWKASNGGSWVTVLLQTAQAFEASKSLSAFSKSVVITPVSGLGDDAYYLAVRDNAGLIVKKGSVAFKVAVYQHGPLGPKQTTERTLAEKILPRM